MFILALITNQSLFQFASSEGLMLGSQIAPQHDFHGYVWIHGAHRQDHPFQRLPTLLPDLRILLCCFNRLS